MAVAPFVVPDGLTEAEILAAIERSVEILAPGFVFGYFDIDDIKQFARMEGIKAVVKWDRVRPFGNFAYTVIRSRLLNLVRDELRRSDPPCSKCHSGSSCGGDGRPCKMYQEWASRNNTKANLMRPLDLQRISDEKEARTRNESEVYDSVELAEILEKIDTHLPVELRSTYLQMRDGVAVPKAKRLEVEKAVKEILKEDIDAE